MHKTPTAYKWMTDMRARRAADVERLQKLEAEVSERLAQARGSLQALDRTMLEFDKTKERGLGR